MDVAVAAAEHCRRNEMRPTGEFFKYSRMKFYYYGGGGGSSIDASMARQHQFYPFSSVFDGNTRKRIKSL